jgi:thiol-disulfide isomerase/thioredoxin
VDCLVVLVGALFLLSDTYFLDSLYSGNMLNTPAPDFTLTTLANEPVTLKALHGKPVVLNFWATWCPPCREELPVLEAGYSRHQAGIHFLAISSGEDQVTVQEFVKEKTMILPVLLDPEKSVSGDLYYVIGLPTTIFIDAEGLIVKRHIGSLDEATLEKYLAELEE